MKNLCASFFLWMFSGSTFGEVKSKGFAASPAKPGLVQLWHLGMVMLLATILLAFSTPVAGQAVNATLLGTVTDSSGAAVGNAKITITETNTGINRSSQTNESGNYVLPDLPPGTYTVTA